MSSIEVKFEGLEELNKKLKELTKKMSGQELSPIFHEAGNMVASAVRTHVPTGPTGNLKSGIVAKPLTPRKFTATEVVGVYWKKAPHAHLVEYGTTSWRLPHTAKVLYDKKTDTFFGTMVKPMPAHPFMRPGWDESKSRVISFLEKKLSKQAESV